MIDKPVLITTSHRGVFFGILKEKKGNSCILEGARCAIRFGTDGGFIELASTGPTSNGKIGAPSPANAEFYDVTSVIEVSEEAAKKWTA